MRSTITTLLDLAGLLLLVAAAAVFVAAWTIPGALAVAGVGFLSTSWLVDRRAA